MRIYLYVKKGTLNLQKKAHAKIGTLNLQNEAVPMCKKTMRKNWHLKCEKKTHAKIGTLNLQNEAVPMCEKTTRKNWHLKCAKKKHTQKLASQICKTRQCLSAKKVRAKIGTLNLQNEAVSICKKSTRKNWHVKSAKRGSTYLQKKYVQKLAR